MACVVAYKFRGIQEYLKGGGRLLDVAGGSEIIDSLCREGLGFALKRLGLMNPKADASSLAMIPGTGTVLQAASGLIIIRFEQEDTARRFVRLWPLLADQWAPQGRHAVALQPVAGDNVKAAVEDARDHVTSGSGLPPFALPGATPLTMRMRRTGGPVVEIDRFRDDDELDDRDASTILRRQRVGRNSASGLENLKDRFGFGGLPLTRDADALAEAGGSSILAVIHADGSGFGAMFKAVTDKHGATGARVLSQTIAGIVQAAAQEAVADLRAVLTKENDIACRPIVLGGDDMTVVVPGRFGLPVARRFLAAFEARSAEALPAFLRTYRTDALKDRPHLTAGAGIAYVHAHHPFSDAVNLAETLCGWAKTRLDGDKTKTSCLMVHRALDTDTGDFKEVFAEQFILPASGDQPETWLTAGPYVTTPIDGYWTLQDLDALLGAVRPLPLGTWREIARLLRESDTVAERRLARQYEILGSRANDLKAALRTFTGDEKCLWACDRKPWRTPIHDVDVLLGLEQRFSEGTDDEDRPTETAEAPVHA